MTFGAAGEEMKIWKLYCEGYHDRDFLDGLFEFLGWERPKGLPKQTRYHAYQRGVCRVQIFQCMGKSLVKPAFEAALAEAGSTRPAGLVMCHDEDDAVDVADARRRARERMLRSAENVPGFDESSLTVQTVVGHAVVLAALTWACTDDPSPSIPDRQNLERLLVSAMCAAYPERGPLVKAWLESRIDAPDDPSSISKAYSWSHMAGWYPSPGGQSFFKQVWADGRVAAELAERMPATGIDAMLSAMGFTPPWASSQPGV